MSLKARGNVAVTFNSNALTNYLNKASLDGVVNAIDTTNFGSTNGESVPGTPSWKVPIGGQWSSTLGGYLAPDIITPVLRTLAVVIGGVTWTWTASGAVGAFITDYKEDASNPNGIIEWSATLTCSGAPVRS